MEPSEGRQTGRDDLCKSRGENSAFNIKSKTITVLEIASRTTEQRAEFFRLYYDYFLGSIKRAGEDESGAKPRNPFPSSVEFYISLPPRLPIVHVVTSITTRAADRRTMKTKTEVTVRAKA